MNLLMKIAVLAVPLAFAGTAANAVPSHHVKAKATHVARVHGRMHIAAHRRPLRTQPEASIAQLINYLLGQAHSLGYTVPICAAQLSNGHWQVSHDDDASADWTSPSDDNSAAAAAASDAETQAATDAENAAIQQMNDTNAMTASMAATEAQNDAANAATLQTELNANN